MAVEVISEELQYARRAFPQAQVLLSGSPSWLATGSVMAGWHDTRAYPEDGALAVVRDDGPLTDLVGEILRVSTDSRSVFVYCHAAVDVPYDLSLYRRAFLGLSRLSRETLDVAVEVL